MYLNQAGCADAPLRKQDWSKSVKMLLQRSLLSFSTNVNPEKSKTKCIIFSKKAQDVSQVVPIILNGDPLPWVAQVKHLGNTLQCDNTMRMDMSMKMGKFIGKLSSLQQEFHSVESMSM